MRAARCGTRVLAALLGGALMAGCGAAPSDSSGTPWNIVLILVDDLGWTDLHAWRNDTSAQMPSENPDYDPERAATFTR
jgi:hypothetical protein